MKNYIERLKNYWKINDLTFIATFNKVDDKHGYFINFINPESKKPILYPVFDEISVNEKRVSFMYFNVNKLENNQYYKVELKYTDNPKGKNNPYSLEIKSVTELNQNVLKDHLAGNTNLDLLKNVFQIKRVIEKEKAKNHIKQRFERLNNPEANKIIANLMREIGKGMYSSKQRMIFELLQNADDAPGKEKVEFHIDAKGDYLFIMHDGAPFNMEDVDAITSAAESTKRKDKKKTGYKGIGFKSVFTDSEEVWIKSGSYQFSFMKKSPLFEDFETFHFSSSEYKEFPRLIEIHREKYKKEIESYNSSTDIPWQVIPIWQDDLPDEFTDSNFNNFNNPVQFALKVGANNIYGDDGYLTAISNIVKRPQFLLFLRNTSKFRSPKNKVTVSRTDNQNLIIIEKTLVEYIDEKSNQIKDILEYTKQIYSDIKVNNEAFDELNIGLKKIVEKNDLNEDTHYFVDLDGNKIDTIPPKLASATETEISFGIPLVNQKISPEKEYIKRLPKYSSLFTYLPMEDNRFQLPFLVNADFVPSSDRQRIQGDNLWNKYIMTIIAEKHVNTLELYALGFINDNSHNISYLSLLLMNLLPEDDTAQQIIDNYNQKYLEQLKIKKIVVNDKNESQLLLETILDISGLTELFGNEIFYEIINTEKRLPHSNLETKYLKNYEYLNIEKINLEELASQITPELCEALGVIIANNSLYEKKNLFNWLNKLVKFMPNNFGKIPFIVHNNALFSLERLIEEDDAWLINEQTFEYASLIKEIGYNTILLNLDEYSNIKEFLHSLDGYLKDKTTAYQRIASNENLHLLPISSKIKLIDFFQNSPFMVGLESKSNKYFGELKLFLDENNNPRPLRQLISRKENLDVYSINKFRIKETEYNSISEVLKKELIKKEEIFTSFILNEVLFEEWNQQFDSNNINSYVSDLKTIFSWVDNKDDISIAKWASIPWLFIDDKLRFLTSEKVYWSKAFNQISSDKFLIIKNILENKNNKILPVIECGFFNKYVSIKIDDNSEIDWSEVESLEIQTANILLDWMEDDRGFGDFFNNYTFITNNDGYLNIEKIKDIQIYDGSDLAIKNYVETITNLSSSFKALDTNLCSENRSKIGLLQGDKLIKAIIESGEFDQNLALHLSPNLSFELLNDFIFNLNDFNLFTDIEYRGDSPEHFIISRLLKSNENLTEQSAEIENTIQVLRNKTYIDGKLLSNYTVSDRVSFGTKEDRKVLRLSEILTEFQGESDVLDKVTKSFIAITQQARLRELIFKTIPLKPSEIQTKIEAESSPYYSVHQVIFKLLDKKYGGKINWSKKQFDDYFNDQEDEKQLHSSYQKFLDILIDLPFTDLSDFEFINLELKNCVDKNFAIESEYLPDWLEEWVNKDKVKRLEFLTHLEYNGINSPIVNLRKALIDEGSVSDEIISFYSEAKSNPQIIWNTISWLSKFEHKIITKNKEFINKVNDSVNLNIDGVTGLIIPVIQTIINDKDRLYSLEKIEFSTNLYFINDNQNFVDILVEKIKSVNKDVVFIDGICGKMTKYFQIKTIELSESIDEEVLKEKSTLWSEDYYKKWEHYEKCQIYIYEGDEIPHKISYDNITIIKSVGSLMEEYEGAYYFSKILKNSILNHNPTIIPEEKFKSLKDFYIYFKENPDEFENNPYQEKYNETFDRMIQDRYGISEERQNDENSNAKKQALYFLEDNGFKVNEGHSTKDYAALYNIVDTDGNKITFIVRSAKGGLLFLDKEHWEMLEANDTKLIAIYPGNKPRIFTDRMELLSDELQEKILFRIPNNKNINELDRVFNGLESESHMILITSEKMKESLFSKLNEQVKIKMENDVAIGGDTFED